jgi:1-acyl-sn-glycerol-3-phosphate acyltransferase
MDELSDSKDQAVSAHAHDEGSEAPAGMPVAALPGAVGGTLPVEEGIGPVGVDRWGRSEHFVETITPIADFLYDRYFRVEVDGIDNIPDSGALLVSNHAGALPPDALQIVWALRRHLHRHVYMMGDHLLARIPVLSTMFRRIGGVEADPETARRLLGVEGQLGLVFPEGTKSTGKPVRRRYRLARFGRGGYIRVAIDAGVPIVPVAVVGAEEAMPVLANIGVLARALRMPYVPVTTFVWLPAKFHLRFLEPVEVASGASDDHTVQVVSDAIREMIQAALFDMLSKRRWVLFG